MLCHQQEDYDGDEDRDDNGNKDNYDYELDDCVLSGVDKVFFC